MNQAFRIPVWFGLPLVLAAGAGWYLGGGTRPEPTQAPAPSPVTVERTVVVTAPPADRTVVVTGPPVERTVVVTGVPAERTVVVTAPPLPTPSPAVVERTVVVSQTVVVIATPQAGVPSVAQTGASPPSAGEVYRADWAGGLGGWTGGASWKAVSGMLVNDGQEAGYTYIMAPFTPTTPDYSVEAVIQLARGGEFGLAARHDGKVGYWWRYQDGGFRITTGATGDTERISDVVYFTAGTDFHTYRLEVKGNAIRGLIDGSPRRDTTDNRLLSPGTAGLWVYRSQINVRSFRITVP